MAMKTLFVPVAVVSILFTLAVLISRPISTNFFTYCRWRLFSDIATKTGVALSHHDAIHYTVYGRGKPLLLLHGGLSSRLCWFSQLPFLTAAGFQPITVDSRGHGESELGEEELSYRLLADDALAVLDQLKIDKADIIGWSDGANTALVIAASSPRRIEKIIAISANYAPDGLTDEAQRDNRKQSAGIQHIFSRWLTGAGRKFQELEKQIKKLWQGGYILQTGDLQKISAATLLIVCEKDSVTIGHTQIMHQHIPDSAILIVKDGGHTTLITHAAEINETIKNFLSPP